MLILGPNDIWDFNYFLHCGPGILLNRIYEEMYDPEKQTFKDKNLHPTSYGIILQADGDPRTSMTRKLDGENFNGSGPGRFTYSFQRRLKFVKKQTAKMTILTNRMFIDNDEDFEEIMFQDYFTPDRQQKINVSPNQLNVNRLENDLLYQVRYGEGRLATYTNLLLQEVINQNNSTDTDTDTSDESGYDPTEVPGGVRGSQSGGDVRDEL